VYMCVYVFVYVGNSTLNGQMRQLRQLSFFCSPFSLSYTVELFQ